MARVPEVATAGGVAGAARGALDPRGFARAIRQPTGEFEALAEAAETFGLQIRADQIARDNVRSVQVQSEAERRIEAGIADLDPLAETFDEDVRRVVDEATAEARGNANLITRQVTDDLERRLTALGEGSFTIALRTRRGAIEDQALAVRQEAVDEALADIRADPDGFDTYVSRFQGRAERLNAGISKDKIPGLSREFLDATIIAQVEGYALLGGKDNIARANQVIDANEENLTPAQSRGLKGLVRAIDNNNRQDFLAATDRTIADIEIGIAQGENFNDFEQSRIAIEAADEAGLFEGREGRRVSLLKQLENKKNAKITDDDTLARAQAKFLAGVGLNTPAEANALWADHAARLPEDMSPQERLEDALHWQSRAGYMPPPIADAMESAERVDNPALLATSTAYLDRARIVAPNSAGMEKAGDRQALTSALVDLNGISYLEAATLVNDNLPDRQTIKQRQDQFAEEFGTDFDPIESAADHTEFSEDELRSEDGQLAARRFERKQKIMYQLHGDKDTATSAAAEDLSQRWGRTRVFGRETIQELPPEKILGRRVDQETMGQIDLEARARIITDDLAEILRDADFPAVPNEELGLPGASLVTDEQTVREWRAGEPVSYEIRTLNEFNILVPIPNKDNTANARYTPPQTLEQLQATPTWKETLATETKKVKERQRQIRELELITPEQLPAGGMMGSMRRINDQSHSPMRRRFQRRPLPGVP